MQKPRIACVFAPGFGRGARAIGASRCLFEHGLWPKMITGCSAGALAAESVVAGDKEELERAEAIWSALTPGKISRPRWADDILVGSLVAGALLHVIPPLAKGVKSKKAERVIRALLSLGMQAASIKAFLEQSSIFSNDPLYRLLTALNMKKIFASETKMIITAAKYRSGERSVYTNFLPEDRNRAERLLRGSMASATIVPEFPPIKIDEDYEFDGVFAEQDFLAFDLIEKYCECDHILFFVFYWLPKEERVGGFVSVSGRAHELMVEHMMRSILERLPQTTKDKLIVVELDEPPERADLRKFSKRDVQGWISEGYRTTERVLIERGWA